MGGGTQPKSLECMHSVAGPRIRTARVDEYRFRQTRGEKDSHSLAGCGSDAGQIDRSTCVCHLEVEVVYRVGERSRRIVSISQARVTPTSSGTSRSKPGVCAITMSRYRDDELVLASVDGTRMGLKWEP